MRNPFISALAVITLVVAVLGCTKLNSLSGRSGTASNKGVVDKTIDSTVGDKIGIPECDDVIDELAGLNETDENDSYVMKAFRSWYVGKIREAIRKSIEENKNDKTQLAKECRDFKKQLEKYKTEESQKK